MDCEIVNNRVEIKTENVQLTHAAFRVFDTGENSGDVIYYASSRLGSIENTDSGYRITVPEDFAGNLYELKSVDQNNVIVSGCLKNSAEQVKAEAIQEEIYE